MLALLFESSVLGDRTFLGTKVSLVPAYVCCVACREGHEAGGWFALAATFFWVLSGVTGGPIFMVLLPVASILAAFVCNTWLTRSLFPALAGCLLATALCRVGVYLQRLYMDYPLPPRRPAVDHASTALFHGPRPPAVVGDRLDRKVRWYKWNVEADFAPFS